MKGIYFRRSAPIMQKEMDIPIERLEQFSRYNTTSWSGFIRNVLVGPIKPFGDTFYGASYVDFPYVKGDHYFFPYKDQS